MAPFTKSYSLAELFHKEIEASANEKTWVHFGGSNDGFEDDKMYRLLGIKSLNTQANEVKPVALHVSDDDNDDIANAEEASGADDRDSDRDSVTQLV